MIHSLPADAKASAFAGGSIINYQFFIQMNVVLFGGSFNPPHIGHQMVITQAFELIPNIDELWLVPDYHHTFSKDKDFAPPHHRLAMAKLLLPILNQNPTGVTQVAKHAGKQDPSISSSKSTHADEVISSEEQNNRKTLTPNPLLSRVDVSKRVTRIHTYNLDHQTSGDSIITVRALKQQYPTHQFSFLMGSDNLQTFTQWGSWEALVEEIPFYIYPRAGFPFKPLYKNMHPLEHPLQAITNTSSTIIRNRLHQELTIRHLVPQPIETYITTHHLYT